METDDAVRRQLLIDHLLVSDSIGPNRSSDNTAGK